MNTILLMFPFPPVNMFNFLKPNNNNNNDEKLPKHNHSAELLAYGRYIRLARPLAYSNEVAESFRHILPKLITPMYVVSFGYIGADISHKMALQYYKPKRDILMPYQLFDASLWHGTASMALPSLTIHTIVKQTKNCQKWELTPRTIKFAPIILGLSSIPIIVKPIDHFVDWMMDKYVRVLYPKDIRNEIHV